jgi:hypothetical protein
LLEKKTNRLALMPIIILKYREIMYIYWAAGTIHVQVLGSCQTLSGCWVCNSMDEEGEGKGKGKGLKMRVN